MSHTIPVIDVAPLFAQGWDASGVDSAIFTAASDSGFMAITGLPDTVPLHEAGRQALMRLFGLPDATLMRLARAKDRPGAVNRYRGYYPVTPGSVTRKRGLDIGADLVHPEQADDADVLTETSPLPEESDLPGWRADAVAYYQGMERIGHALLRSFARSFDLPERILTEPFRNGISTFRIIHYPALEPEEVVPADALAETPEGPRRIIGAPHVDSGFVTLLQLDRSGGLQAKAKDGVWVDVPVIEGSLVVNFGGLLQRWTGGRVRATEHRVLAPLGDRYSIPFFFEPAVDAVFSPLPGIDAPGFEPFVYGDYVWAAMQEFVEFKGIHRDPKGLPAQYSPAR